MEVTCGTQILWPHEDANKSVIAGEKFFELRRSAHSELPNSRAKFPSLGLPRANRFVGSRCDPNLHAGV